MISAALKLSLCSKIRWISRPSRRAILSGIHAYYEPEELIGKTLIAITNLPQRPMMGIESCGMLLSAVNERNREEELHLLMVDNHIPAGRSCIDPGKITGGKPADFYNRSKPIFCSDTGFTTFVQQKVK